MSWACGYRSTITSQRIDVRAVSSETYPLAILMQFVFIVSSHPSTASAIEAPCRIPRTPQISWDAGSVHNQSQHVPIPSGQRLQLAGECSTSTVIFVLSREMNSSVLGDPVYCTLAEITSADMNLKCERSASRKAMRQACSCLLHSLQSVAINYCEFDMWQYWKRTLAGRVRHLIAVCRRLSHATTCS